MTSSVHFICICCMCCWSREPPYTMRSRPALLLLAVLHAASAADFQDLYVAVGKQFVIPLETKLDHLEHFCSRFVWKYQKSALHYLGHIAQVDGDCKKTDCTRPDCSLSNNGSLLLHHVTAQDSGLYTVTTYHPNRNPNTERKFHLHVLDAVSDPVVTFQCLSNDSLLVMCSAEKGTKPHIQLTINEETFWESEMRFINVTKSLPPPWNITCSAKNNVSQEMTTVFFKTCPEMGEKLGVVERYVKVFLFIMYNALLVHCLLEMRRTAAANQ